MATKQSTKGTRADRRITKLIAYWETKLNDTDEAVQLQAAEKLTEILLRQAELRDRADEREYKREMAGLRKAFTPTAPAVAPVLDIDRTIADLRRQVAERERGKQALATDDSEKSWFD
jgi:hypothetical protein